MLRDSGLRYEIPALSHYPRGGNVSEKVLILCVSGLTWLVSQLTINIRGKRKDSVLRLLSNQYLTFRMHKRAEKREKT